MIYAFKGCELDSERHELRLDGRTVELQPKVLVLLLHLLRNRQRVISREELFALLWPDVVVSEDALFSALRKARSAVGDDGGAQQVIATVPKVGYRFVAAVEERAERPASAPARAWPAPDAAPGAAAASPSLVGRDQELAKLRGALASVLDGSGKVAFVSGEAGIGKSRLAAEFVTLARASGAEVHEATSWHGPGEPALWLWTQVLRAFAAEWSAEDLSRVMGAGAPEIARLAPALERKLGLEVPAVRDTDEARFLLMDAITRFVVHAAKVRPQVLLLEDLQWAPPATHQVLAFLARELGHARVLVVATCRTEETRHDHPLFEAIEACEQADALVRVSLGGFDADDLARFTAQVAGFTAPPALVDALHAATGGNPFFVKQIVRLASDEPGTEQDLMSRLASHVGTMPASVRRVLERRLEMLSLPCRKLVEAAAVIGAEFSLAVLTRVSDLPRKKLLDLLDEALAARLLENAPRTQSVFRFAHALVRDAAYAGLQEPVRVQLHHQVAEALETLHAGRLEPVASSLAHHYGEAALLLDGTQAVHYAKLAGDLASAALSYEEAAAHYERALQAFDLLADTSDTRRRAELLVCVGYAHHNAGRFVRARELLHEAAGLALGVRDRALLALAAVGYAEIGLGVADPEPVRFLEAAVTLLDPGHDFVHVWLRSVLAVHLVNHRGRLGDAQDLVVDAKAMARVSGDPRSLCYALCARAAVLRLSPSGRPEERVVLLREAEALASETGDRSIEMMGLIQLRGVLIELGDLAAAGATNARMEQLLQRMRTRFFGGVPDGFRVAQLLLEGRFDEAEERIRLGLPTSDGPRGVFAMAATALACVRYGQGRMGELAPVLSRLVDERPNLLTASAAQILVLLDAGDTVGARACFEDFARRNFDDVPGTESFVFTLSILAEACVRLGDVARAGVLSRMLAAHAPYCATVSNGFYVHGPVAVHLGRLASVMADWNAAERYLDLAAERAEALRSPVWRAYVLAARARLYLARDERGDRPRARAAATEAVRIAKPLGMAGLLRDVQSAL